MKIGIIGGSGLDDPKFFSEESSENVMTPYGAPSSEIKIGKINNVEVCLLARHGTKHTITPTQVNYQANIFALKKLGCTHIISTTAVGSLRQEIQPGHLIILDQFIDFTRHRKITFYENFEKGIEHISLADPFSKELNKKIIQSISELNFPFHSKGTVITIEGPRFSTRAESKMFQTWGADVINMSIAPEATLAREAGLEYSAIAMSTDYDCWKESEEAVTADMVLDTMGKNADKVKQVLVKTIEKFSEQTKYSEIKNSIRTIPNFPKPGIMFRDITTLMQNPEAMRKTLEILYNRYKDKQIDIVAGIEARGFIFGGSLAEKLNCSFVPIRKKGKLPHETISQEYDLEYGTDTVEIHRDAISHGQKVLVIDDLIATGGTAQASCKLIEKLGGQIIECAFVIDLPDLKGKEKLSQWPVFSIVEFEGE